jgi:hypothetical protein
VIRWSHDYPPDAVTQDLDRLSGALDSTIPAKGDTKLLVAIWNVRAFGNLTNKLGCRA